MQYSDFIENYRVYSSGNETPEIMHIWSGLSALAGACEKRMWIDQHFFQLYLNLYVILIGPAGVVAKSTSMGLALKMLKEAGFNVLEGAVLKEKIIEDMEAMVRESPLGFQHASVTYVANELNVMLSSGVDMVKFLVDIYDKGDSYVYKTKKSGQYEIPHPAFNMIAAAVPQWFGDYVASDLGSTGFLARCIIVYEEEKRGSYPKLRYTEEQKVARQKCMEIIYAVSQMNGEVPMSKEADDYFCEWYNNQKHAPTRDYRINSYIERKNKIHVLKIAALMAIGDLRQEITELDIKRSVDLLDWTEKKMRLAYVIAGANKLAPYIHQIISIMESNGGKMDVQEVVRTFCHELSIDEIRELMTTVEDMGEAKRVKEGRKTWLEKT